MMYWPINLHHARQELGPKFMGHYARNQSYRPNYGYHTGLDFCIPPEHTDPVMAYAIADGIVQDSSPILSPRGYGEMLLIHHPSLGLWTRYGHLHSRSVEAGESVQAGQMIGQVGQSGTDNVHLHFDIIRRPLPMPRYNPHNPKAGGVLEPKSGLDLVEATRVLYYFSDPLVLFQQIEALIPETNLPHQYTQSIEVWFGD